MALFGGNKSSNVEGPYQIFNGVTTTATATSHTSTDSVACRGAKAVYFIVYDSTRASSAVITSITPQVVNKSGLTAVASNAGWGAGAYSVTISTGTWSLAQGAVGVLTPPVVLNSANNLGIGMGYHGRIFCESAGVIVVSATGVNPSTIRCDVFVVWV